MSWTKHSRIASASAIAIAVGVAAGGCSKPAAPPKPNEAWISRGLFRPQLGPARAPSNTPLHWRTRDGRSWVPLAPFESGAPVHSVDGAGALTSLLAKPGRVAIVASPSTLCEIAPAIASARDRVALDLTAEGPLTQRVVDCWLVAKPAAVSFVAPGPRDGGLSTRVTTILTHLEFCEALGIEGAGDAIARLLGERADAADGAWLESVALPESELSADALAVFAQRTTLRGVGLFGMKSTQPAGASGLTALATLPRLEWLELTSSAVTDDDLAGFATRHEALRRVSLGSTAITDRGALALVAGAPKLTELDLGGTQVGDATARALGDLCCLSTLGLAATRLTDEGAAELARLTTLEALDLRTTQVTAATLDALAPLVNLRALALPRTLAPGAVAQFRARHPGVRVEF